SNSRIRGWEGTKDAAEAAPGFLTVSSDRVRAPLFDHRKIGEMPGSGQPASKCCRAAAPRMGAPLTGHGDLAAATRLLGVPRGPLQPDATLQHALSSYNLPLQLHGSRHRARESAGASGRPRSQFELD